MSAVSVGVRGDVVVFLKTCEGPCGQTKVASSIQRESEFPSNGSKNGRPYFKPLCKKCYAAAHRVAAMTPEQREHRNALKRAEYARSMADPEQRALVRNRERDHRREMRKKDPEFVAAERRRSREWRRRKREQDPEYFSPERRAQRAAERQERARASSSGKGGRSRLAADPFRDWLAAYSRARGGLSSDEIGQELGIVGRRVRGVLYDGQDHVSLDVVDRALTNSRIVVHAAGRVVVTLDDLYPFGAAA